MTSPTAGILDAPEADSAGAGASSFSLPLAFGAAEELLRLTGGVGAGAEALRFRSSAGILLFWTVDGMVSLCSMGLGAAQAMKIAINGYERGAEKRVKLWFS